MRRIVFSAVVFFLYYTITCFSQGSPTIIWSVQANPTLIDKVSVTSNGQMILTSSQQHARTFSIVDGSLIDNFEYPGENLISSSLSPAGDSFTVGYTVGTYPPSGQSALNDLSSGNVIFTLPGCFTAYSHDGSKVAGTGGGVYRYVNVHLTANGTELFNIYNGGYPGYVQFSPDDHLIAVASSDNTIKLYDSDSGTLIRTLSGHTNDVNTVAFSPDGMLIASGAGGWDASGESTIKIWNVINGDLITTLPGHDYWVDDLAFSSNGLYLLSSGRDGLYPSNDAKIKIWRTSDWELDVYYDEEVANGVPTLTAVKGTNYFVYGNSYGELFLASFPDVIPVELTSFSASIGNSKVTLNWTTATELNNYGFEILRSTQNENWQKIGFVKGYGNSVSPKDYSFVDNSVTKGIYSYRLKQIDNDGSFEYSKVIEVDLGTQAEYELTQNYPNPFNPVTTIRYNLPESGNVKLNVYNLLGEQVAVLVDEFKETGVHTVNFNAENLQSGFYIYKIEANGFVQSRKMTLIK